MRGDRMPARVLAMRLIPRVDTGLRDRLGLGAEVHALGLITCDSIQEAVANYYGLNVADLKSPKRNHEITVPRQIAMYLTREMMGLSLTRIGDAFGGRHYTTVMSSISKVEDSIRQSPSLVSLLDDIRRMIKNPA